MPPDETDKQEPQTFEKQLHKQCTETRDVLSDTVCCVRTTLE